MTPPPTRRWRGNIGIGDLAALTGVSPRALRFYESKGLIEARRDRYNARYYDVDGRDRAILVVRLRRAGLPVDSVRELLRLQDEGKPIADVAMRLIAVRLERLDRERRDLVAALDELGGVDGPGRAAPVAG